MIRKSLGITDLMQIRSCLPTLKPWQPSPCMGLSCYRCHGQLSRTCVPNLSVDYFNQSCSAEGKITLTVILPHKAVLSHEAK